MTQPAVKFPHEPEEREDPRNALLDAAADMIRTCVVHGLEWPLRRRLGTILPDTRREESPAPLVTDTRQAGVVEAASKASGGDLGMIAPADLDRAVRLASLAEFLKRQGRAARNAVNRDELAAHEAFIRDELASLRTAAARTETKP